MYFFRLPQQLHDLYAIAKKETILNRTIMFILISYPALLLTVNGSMGVLFFLLLIISLTFLYRIRAFSISHFDGYSTAFALAMASPVVAIFLSQAYHYNFNSQYYDWAARFLLSIPIFLALRRINISVIHILQFGMPLGALIILLALILHPFDWQFNRHTTSEAFNLIHFADSALMIGLLSFFCINWERKDHALILLLKLCGFIAGLYMSIQSGERGGWIAIPPLVLLWVLAHSKERIWGKFCLAILMVIAAIWLSYTSIDMVHYKVNAAFDELNQYTIGSKDTSTGIRLQLWQAALQLLSESPFFGVGPGGFAQALPALVDSGRLTPLAAYFGHGEVHSELLAKCAETGLFGLASILSVFLVPLFVFWRATKSTDSSVRIAGFMGICLVSGFFIFGLTVEIFNLIMTSAFFSLTLAVLMAAAMHKPIK